MTDIAVDFNWSTLPGLPLQDQLDEAAGKDYEQFWQQSYHLSTQHPLQSLFIHLPLSRKNIYFLMQNYILAREKKKMNSSKASRWHSKGYENLEEI